MTYQPKVYRDNGGDRQVVASGGTALIESGATLQVDSGAQVSLFGASIPASITFAAAAAAANVCEVTCTVKDGTGATLAGVFNFDLWLSDDAIGAGLTATSASGTVTAKAASGAVIATHSAKKALKVQTLATGVFILEITDTAKTVFFVCAQVPSTGAIDVSTQLAAGDYGA